MNAKSILGMLAMGFNHVMKMNIYAENADDLIQAVNKFLLAEFEKVDSPLYA